MSGVRETGLNACQHRGACPRTPRYPAWQGFRRACEPENWGLGCIRKAEPLRPENLGYRVLPTGAYAGLNDEGVKTLHTNKLFAGSGRDDDPPDLPK